MEHQLYVIEGLDGSGKATQAALLTEHLSAKGLPCRKLSFPDYDDPSSTLVKTYLHGEIGTLEEVNPYGASLFFTVDRYASYCRHWRPDYEAGKILVARTRCPACPVRNGMTFLTGYVRWSTKRSGCPALRRWSTLMLLLRFPAVC